jgi:riboflavin biosynthesis pyrimidine reductase
MEAALKAREESRQRCDQIRARIKEMQLDDPQLTFRQCWEKLQRTEPSLFEGLD